MKKRDPRHQLEFLLAEVARQQIRVYNSRFRSTGLNQSQVAALIHLDRSEALVQSEIADRVGIGRAAAGTLVDGLEEKGLVERVRGTADRRTQQVSITDEGRAVVEGIDRLAEDLGREYRTGVSVAERRALIGVLGKLRENLRIMDASAAMKGAER